MRWQQKFSTVCALVPAVLVPLALTGCGSSGRTTTVAQTWDERPRFFTAEPGAEHSRFANAVWYDRPRFFTKAEDEDQSRFSRTWGNRPGAYTTQAEYTTTHPSTTHGTTSYGTTHYGNTTYDNTGNVHYRTIPVESHHNMTHHDHKNCDCPHKNRIRTEKTHYNPTTINTYPKTHYPGPTTSTFTHENKSGTLDRNYTTGNVNTVNTYGAATHQNVTQPQNNMDRQSRVALTGDVGNRSFDTMISNWPQDSRTAAIAMQAKYGPPDSSSGDRIIWRDQDPFAEIVVMKNGTPQSFPTQHTAVLAQSIYFNVNADQLDELSDFRGNVKVDLSKGFLTSTCKDEAGNFLALNLAHEILTGEKSAVEANSLLIEKARSGIKDDDYMMSLQFDVGVDVGDDLNNGYRNMDVDTPETDRD